MHNASATYSTKIPQNSDPSSGSSQHRKLAQLASCAHHKLTISKSSGHLAHPAATKMLLEKKKKRQLLLPALQSSPIAHVLLQNASLLQCPLPWTPHFILDHEVDLKQGQVALQAVESFTKVPKIKDQMLPTWVTSGPTNIHDVQK